MKKKKRHKVTILFVMFIYFYFTPLLGGIFGRCLRVGKGKAKLPSLYLYF